MTAGEAVGWLLDYVGPVNDTVAIAWKVVTKAAHGVTRRPVEPGALDGIPLEVSGLPAGGPEIEAGRRAILACIDSACHTNLADALAIQARHSGEFMHSTACRRGSVGAEYQRTMTV